MSELMSGQQRAMLADIESVMRAAHEGGIAEGERRAVAGVVAWLQGMSQGVKMPAAIVKGIERGDWRTTEAAAKGDGV